MCLRTQGNFFSQTTVTFFDIVECIIPDLQFISFYDELFVFEKSEAKFDIRLD
jgi:hypothetical protein